MGKKVIIIIRTSTTKQEVESQKKEVFEFAKLDGYSEDNIIPIGGEGASAIKLDDEYRYNMQRVYETIQQENIACVYAWSIDRIGRDETVLMEFKNYLIKNSVNLKIKNPSLCLLDDDGKVNKGVELAFSLFATMSKQEMETKKERFARAKRRNKNEGRYNGGRMLLGYKVDTDGKYVVDKDGADLVREIFDSYANTPLSTRALANKYVNLGVKSNSLRTREHYIQKILKNRKYIGDDEYNRPAIVSKDVFERVQSKLKNFRTLPKVKYKETPYYCQGLLREMVWEKDENGIFHSVELHPMRVKKSECSYVSYTEKFSLNINNLDSAIVQVVNDMVAHYDTSLIEEQIRQNKHQYEMKLEHTRSQITMKNKKIEKLQDDYYSGNSVSESTYKRNLSLLQRDIEQLRKEEESLSDTILKIKDDEFVKKDLYELDDNAIRDALVKYVCVIYTYKLDKYRSKISITMAPPIEYSYDFVYNRKSKTMEEVYIDANGEPEYRETPIRIIRSIKGRKRKYKGHKKELLSVQG